MAGDHVDPPLPLAVSSASKAEKAAGGIMDHFPMLKHITDDVERFESRGSDWWVYDWSPADMVVSFIHRLPYPEKETQETWKSVDNALALCKGRADALIPPILFTSPPPLSVFRPYIVAFVLGATLSRNLIAGSMETGEGEMGGEENEPKRGGESPFESQTISGGEGIAGENFGFVPCRENGVAGGGRGGVCRTRQGADGCSGKSPNESERQNTLPLLRLLARLVSKAAFFFTAPLLQCCHNPHCGSEGHRIHCVHDLTATPLLLQSALALFRLAESAPEWKEDTETGSWLGCVWELQLTGMMVVRLLSAWSSAVLHQFLKRPSFLRTLRAACEKGPMTKELSWLNVYPREAVALLSTVLRTQPPTLGVRSMMGVRLAEKLGLLDGGHERAVQMAAALLRGALAEIYLQRPHSRSQGHSNRILLINLTERLKDIAAVFRHPAPVEGEGEGETTAVVNLAIAEAVFSDELGDMHFEGIRLGGSWQDMMCTYILDFLIACKCDEEIRWSISDWEGIAIGNEPPTCNMVIGFYQCLAMVLMNGAALEHLTAHPQKLDELIDRLHGMSDASTDEIRQNFPEDIPEELADVFDDSYIHPRCESFIDLLKFIKQERQTLHKTENQQKRRGGKITGTKKGGKKQKKSQRGQAQGGDTPSFSCLKPHSVERIRSKTREEIMRANIVRFLDRTPIREEAEEPTPPSASSELTPVPSLGPGAPDPGADQWRDMRPPPCSGCHQFIKAVTVPSTEGAREMESAETVRTAQQSEEGLSSERASCSGQQQKGCKKNRCGGCGFAYFCNKDCRDVAWKEGGHKEKCRLMALQRDEDGSGNPFDSFRAMVTASCKITGWAPEGDALTTALEELKQVLLQGKGEGWEEREQRRLASFADLRLTTASDESQAADGVEEGDALRPSQQ
uniref:MYND-type domain-containing protein n=1 Tax=Chromera velia CCMP2878 TaxID=1169474 RepID=A0A0G4HC26_9ALVE|eukprot:Cvel_25980.t1-p1 / transcript=Cvel_25980.t1 / gene=Cvel_25980 / organism=Chromera_velia_CCMP2878 / gene_product=hypothetical protein / transcript_product=hypothetical protein / location=Cvel_scaffold3017:12551-16583(+) / protein_length=909 / sequence_SO=supercontig / SO=protein_coding / is_pseudo=false